METPSGAGAIGAVIMGLVALALGLLDRWLQRKRAAGPPADPPPPGAAHAQASSAVAAADVEYVAALGEAKDLRTETRTLRTDVDKLYRDLQTERADRQAESARHEAALHAGEEDRRKLMLDNINVRQELSEQRTQLGRLTAFLTAVDRIARLRYPAEWQTILLEATREPGVTLVLPVALDPTGDPPPGAGV